MRVSPRRQPLYFAVFRTTGRSFNGRTTGSGPVNRGSSPCLPAKSSLRPLRGITPGGVIPLRGFAPAARASSPLGDFARRERGWQCLRESHHVGAPFPSDSPLMGRWFGPGGKPAGLSMNIVERRAHCRARCSARGGRGRDSKCSGAISSGSGRRTVPRQGGPTGSGRLLQVVFVIDPDDTIFVIHARPLTENEKKRYRRRIR